jgi:ribosomal protein S6E (S10)
MWSRKNARRFVSEKVDGPLWCNQQRLFTCGSNRDLIHEIMVSRGRITAVPFPPLWEGSACLAELRPRIRTKTRSFQIPLVFLLLAAGLVSAGEAAGEGLPGVPGIHHDREAEERFELHQNKSKNRLLRGVSMIARFAGKLKQLDKTASVEARRHVSADGAVDYELIAKEGDKTIQKELINRFIGTEVDPHRSFGSEVAVTPENYKFKFKGTREEAGRTVDMFELHPKKKRVGLFKGEVWVDIDTGLSVHESGTLVKSPSVFLKDVRFIRDYEIRDGYALPKSTTIYTKTRFWGMAELDVDYSDVTWDATPAASQAQNQN